MTTASISSDSLASMLPPHTSFKDDVRLSPQLGDLSNTEESAFEDYDNIPEVPDGDHFTVSEKFKSDQQLFLSTHDTMACVDNNPVQAAFLDDSTQGSHSERSAAMYATKTKGSFAGIVAERRAVAATRKAMNQAMKQMGKQDPFQKVNRGLSVIVAKHRLATGKLSPVSSQSSLITMAFSDVNYSYPPPAISEQQGIYQEKSQSTLDENTSVDDVSKIIRAMRRDIVSNSSAVFTDGGSCEIYSPIPIPHSPSSAVQSSTIPTMNLEPTFDQNQNQVIDNDDMSVSSVGTGAVAQGEIHSRQPSARRYVGSTLHIVL